MVCCLHAARCHIVRMLSQYQIRSSTCATRQKHLYNHVTRLAFEVRGRLAVTCHSLFLIPKHNKLRPARRCHRRLYITGYLSGARMHACWGMPVPVHACPCMHARACMPVRACPCVHARACMPVHACPCMHARACMPAHACMHAPGHARACTGMDGRARPCPCQN